MLRRMALVRTDVSEECRFLQEPNGVTSQNKTFFKRYRTWHNVGECHGLILITKFGVKEIQAF
jgi:hypothetical protein